MKITQNRLIDDLVEEILILFGDITNCTVKPPIPVSDIVELLFGLRCDFFTFTGKYRKTSGLLIPKKQWIVVNRLYSENHQRFTLAHELGHWLIDHSDITAGNGIDSTLRILRQKSNKGKERIANYFAASLLMPRSQIFDPAIRLNHDKKIKLCEEYKVSHAALGFRLDDLAKIYGQQQQSTVDNTQSRTYQKPQKLLVSIKSGNLDFRTIWKLKKIRKGFNRIYLNVSDHKIEFIKVLIEHAWIDGFAFVKSDANISEMVENADFRHYTIANDIHIDNVRILSSTHNDECFFYTRSIGVEYEYSQASLLKVEKYLSSHEKLDYRGEAKEFISSQKEQSKTVVIVTGCFDIVTNAHISFLKKAKEFGDVLVVGLEDDSRVRKMKGRNRPVFTISQRIAMMKEFRFVDYTFVIKGPVDDDLKPFYSRLHKYLEPDILVISEGDPHFHDRKEEIENADGILKIVKKNDSDSTSSILGKFLNESEYKELVIIEKEQFNRMMNEIEQPEKAKQLELF